MKNQFKKADKSGARAALIIGEEEAEVETANLKVLRSRDAQETSPSQQTIKQNDVLKVVTNLLESL